MRGRTERPLVAQRVVVVAQVPEGKVHEQRNIHRCEQAREAAARLELRLRLGDQRVVLEAARAGDTQGRARGLRAHEQGQQQEAEHNDSEKCRRVDHVQRPQGSLMVAEAFGVRKRSGFSTRCDVRSVKISCFAPGLQGCVSAVALRILSPLRRDKAHREGPARTCPTRRELTASLPVERTRRKPLVERHADAANAPARRVGRGDHAAEEGDRGDERDT